MSCAFACTKRPIFLSFLFYILILLGHFWLYVWKLQPSRKKEGWEIMKKMCWKNSHKSFGDLKMGTTDTKSYWTRKKKKGLPGRYLYSNTLITNCGIKIKAPRHYYSSPPWNQNSNSKVKRESDSYFIFLV